MILCEDIMKAADNVYCKWMIPADGSAGTWYLLACNCQQCRGAESIDSCKFIIVKLFKGFFKLMYFCNYFL